MDDDALLNLSVASLVVRDELRSALAAVHAIGEVDPFDPAKRLASDRVGRAGRVADCLLRALGEWPKDRAFINNEQRDQLLGEVVDAARARGWRI